MPKNKPYTNPPRDTNWQGQYSVIKKTEGSTYSSSSRIKEAQSPSTRKSNVLIET